MTTKPRFELGQQVKLQGQIVAMQGPEVQRTIEQTTWTVVGIEYNDYNSADDVLYTVSEKHDTPQSIEWGKQHEIFVELPESDLRALDDDIDD